MGNCCGKADVRPYDSYKKITLDDFTVQRAIGKGAFGKVSIVQKRRGGQQFALKYINKTQCIQEKAVHHVVQERNLLEEVRHPFICNLRYSFQDSEYLYMALDLMTGGDLRFHLAKPLKENACKVILAEIASALEYLHAHTIVHRDIKPDNILLDADGHAYLTDFNIAVKFREERPLKSVAGTEPYMAPELLLGQGYFASVDWWSLGVMAYEIMLGERPFRGKHKRDLIKKAEWKFPKTAPETAPQSATSTTTSQTGDGQRKSKPGGTITQSSSRHPRITDHARSFISGLMTVDVTKRLGYGVEGKAALRAHPWLEPINWEKLIAKEIQPIFVPPRNKANFDATHDLEEILLNDNPLGNRSKNKKPNEPPSPEMMVIERQFLYYDFSRPDFVDSQATQTSPVNSLDLIKVHESCVSVDSSKSSFNQRSTSASVSSRSQQFHGGLLNEVPAMPVRDASVVGGVRRALSGAHELAGNYDPFKLGGYPKQPAMSPTQGMTCRAGSGIALAQMEKSNLELPTPPPPTEQATPNQSKMLLDEINSALRLEGTKDFQPATPTSTSPMQVTL
ncbi:hypothetical protein HDU88_006871 [Geranomyces variabilis]|nr:hypothetical protein HDU88_006871 [Geranomyces variabilis]